MSRCARMFAIGAIVLATAAGLTFGLVLPQVALAEDPPPTTVPTPTLPTPDPAPPKPQPKPAPKPTPKPTSRPRQVSPTPTYRPPVASTPPRAAATVKPKVRVTTKPKPKKAPAKKAAVKKERTVLPKVTVTPPVGVLGVSRTFQARSGGSFYLTSLLIVMSLGLAIACFTIAVIPATQVRWRRAAIFVSDRQVDIMLLGCVLLMAGSLMVFSAEGR